MRWKTINDPSGDQSGLPSSTPESGRVTCCAPLPFAPAVKMAPVDCELSSHRRNAIPPFFPCDVTVLPVVARGTRRAAGLRRRFHPRVDVLVGEPLTVAPGGGRAGLATATETVRAALAGLVVELDEVRSNSE